MTYIKLKLKRRRNMLRIIENWPSLRSLASMDLQSLMRSLRSQDKKSVQNQRADSHAERPSRLDRLLEQDEVSEDIQIANGWSTERKSPNVNIIRNGLVGKRRPVAKSTDCMFGRIGYTSGLHVWIIQWPVECRGTHAVVGVATESMQNLHTSGNVINEGFAYYGYHYKNKPDFTDYKPGKCCHRESVKRVL
ncbi:SPRY domain-containing SOCS box protein 4 [Blomia tropicalis]|nr:SPRY domain-containing SOCS box protein 4 [Blomia tropicalis]